MSLMTQSGAGRRRGTGSWLEHGEGIVFHRQARRRLQCRVLAVFSNTSSLFSHSKTPLQRHILWADRCRRKLSSALPYHLVYVFGGQLAGLVQIEHVELITAPLVNTPGALRAEHRWNHRNFLPVLRLPSIFLCLAPPHYAPPAPPRHVPAVICVLPPARSIRGRSDTHLLGVYVHHVRVHETGLGQHRLQTKAAENLSKERWLECSKSHRVIGIAAAGVYSAECAGDKRCEQHPQTRPKMQNVVAGSPG